MSASPDTETGPPIIARLDQVSFSYSNGTHAIKNVSLDVTAGRTLGIVGPSGCGKSTLLSLLAGFASPSAGTLRWYEGDLTAGRHRLSMVFQKDTVLPWLTTRENIELHTKLGSRMRRRGRRQVPIGTDELLEIGGLAAAAEKYPYQLSGGMRRRVAFLTAVAPMPEVLLLDEPFSSLDEPTRIGIHQDVFRVSREFGIAVVIVTHDLAEAVSLCDQIFILSKSPALVVSRHDVPFGNERDMMELRHNDEFLKLYANLWEDLSAQI